MYLVALGTKPICLNLRLFRSKLKHHVTIFEIRHHEWINHLTPSELHGIFWPHGIETEPLIWERVLALFFLLNLILPNIRYRSIFPIPILHRLWRCQGSGRQDCVGGFHQLDGRSSRNQVLRCIRSTKMPEANGKCTYLRSSQIRELIFIWFSIPNKKK